MYLCSDRWLPAHEYVYVYIYIYTKAACTHTQNKFTHSIHTYIYIQNIKTHRQTHVCNHINTHTHKHTHTHTGTGMLALRSPPRETSPRRSISPGRQRHFGSPGPNSPHGSHSDTSPRRRLPAVPDPDYSPHGSTSNHSNTSPRRRLPAVPDLAGISPPGSTANHSHASPRRRLSGSHDLIDRVHRRHLSTHGGDATRVDGSVSPPHGEPSHSISE